MEFQASILASIHDIAAEQWDRCLGPDDLLVSHRHLAALEDSGVASPENGFTPSHVVLRDANSEVAAAAPAYLKTHNEGEMGVDMGLRMAHERMVGPYFPKLQVEVPITTFTGPRLFVRSDVDRKKAMRALVGALKEVAEVRGASSVQIAYMAADSEDVDLLRELEMEISRNNTYVWRAAGDTSFDQYLGSMTGRRRHMVKQERRQVAAQGLEMRYFRGRDITPEMAEKFFDLYVSTFERHANKPLLNVDYFRRVFETMPEVVDLSISTEGGGWAGALMSVNGPSRGHALYWGQSGDIRYLHFEQVTYRSIERAFVTGLEAVDFGGIGAHKAPRGLWPEPVTHAFWFRDAGMREVAKMSCKQKYLASEKEKAEETARLPFAARDEN